MPILCNHFDNIITKNVCSVQCALIHRRHTHRVQGSRPKMRYDDKKILVADSNQYKRNASEPNSSSLAISLFHRFPISISSHVALEHLHFNKNAFVTFCSIYLLHVLIQYRLRPFLLDFRLCCFATLNIHVLLGYIKKSNKHACTHIQTPKKKITKSIGTTINNIIIIGLPDRK